jgi:hypothetical protein
MNPDHKSRYSSPTVPPSPCLLSSLLLQARKSRSGKPYVCCEGQIWERSEIQHSRIRPTLSIRCNKQPIASSNRSCALLLIINLVLIAIFEPRFPRLHAVRSSIGARARTNAMRTTESKQAKRERVRSCWCNPAKPFCYVLQKRNYSKARSWPGGSPGQETFVEANNDLKGQNFQHFLASCNLFGLNLLIKLWFVDFAYQGRDIVFRLIIEYSSLKDFGP